MSFPRTARHLLPRVPVTRRTALTRSQQRFATQDYGSGDGNPAGENPQKQGKNPSEHLEHPGPESPASGGSKKSDGESKAQPKIFNSSPPQDHEASEDVKKHNAEFEQRVGEKSNAQRDKEIEGDKVGKGFWSGTGGAERKP